MSRLVLLAKRVVADEYEAQQGDEKSKTLQRSRYEF